MAKSRSIGGIYASLSLRDGGFKSGIKNARKSLNEFGGKAATGAAVAITALGASMIAAGIAGTKSTLSMVDDLGDVSNQTGIAIADMMKLQRAYADGGREIGMVGKDVGKMQKALVEASSGGKDPFASMGLSAKDLMQLDPAKQFQQIGNALMEIQNPAERTAKAMEIFGKGGMGLTTVFGGIDASVASLGKMPELAERFGAAMGEANDLIGHLPMKSDQFFVGFTSGIIGEILPNLKKIDDFDFTNLGLSIGSAISTAFETITDGSMWEIFSLNAENALMKIQASPAMNNLAAYINTVLDNPIYGAIGPAMPILSAAGLTPGFDSKMDKYKNSGVDANTDLIDENLARIAELIGNAADRFKKKQDEASKPAAPSSMFHPEDFAVPDEVIDGMVKRMDAISIGDTRFEEPVNIREREVNSYQSRGLSLDPSGKGRATEDQVSLLQAIRDILKSAKTTKQLNW